MDDPVAAAAASRASDSFASQPSSPAATLLLDFFFPGLSMFTGALQRYLHVDLNYYFPIFLTLGAITFTWNYISRYVYRKLETHFMSTIEVRYDDEVYDMCMSWVSCQPFAHTSRSLIANTKVGSRSFSVTGYQHYHLDNDGYSSTEEDEYEQMNVADVAAQEKKMTPEALMRKHRRQKKALSYTPSFGTYYFWHKRHLIIFHRSKTQISSNSEEREIITISCLGRNPTVLKELLLEARHMYIERDCQKTVIYRGSSSGRGYRMGEPTWIRCMARNPRPLSTVILNEKVKSDLVSDIKDYLDPATRRWYANRGIPYRRGYLLYGPPGTGKSSLSMSLAGHFKLNIYIVSLNGTAATEETLTQLFNDLPRKCIVLLEDIDTAGLTHTRESEQDDKGSKAKDKDGNGLDSESESSSSSDSDSSSDTPRSSKKTKDSSSKDSGASEKKSSSHGRKDKAGKLSLSGLLNILDGVASQEGRLLIMTTNHIEKLDKALIRPGRVDSMVKFDRADRDMMEALFKSIFTTLEGDSLYFPTKASRVSNVAASDDDCKKAADEKKAELIHTLASTFSSSVPELMFSPAELQGYLLKHKRDPIGAVEGVKDWVAETNAAKVKSDRRKELRAERSKERDIRRKAKAARKKDEKEKKGDKEKVERRRRKKKLTAKAKMHDPSDSDADSETSCGSEADGGKKDRSEVNDKNDKNDKNGTKTTARIKRSKSPAEPAEPASPSSISTDLPVATPLPSVSGGSSAGDLSDRTSDVSSKATTVDHGNVSEVETSLREVAAKMGT